MMGRVMIVILLLCTSLAHAQVSVGVMLQKDTFNIGEPVTATLQITTNLDNIDTIDFTPYTKVKNLIYEVDSSRFEKYLDLNFKGDNHIGVSNDRLVLTGDLLKGISGDLHFSIYSMGGGIIPNPIVKLKDGSQVMYMQESPIFVMPSDGVISALDSLKLADIKPIMKEGSHWTDYLIYLYTLLGLLFLGVLFWYLSKRKKEEEVVEVYLQENIDTRPAHQIALEELQALDMQKLWQSGKVKEYQSSLTDIMRRYLDNRYDISAGEMTTRDIKQALGKANISQDLSSQFIDILLIADKVKFAKGTAGPELNQRFMEQAINWIHQTKQSENIEDTE